MKHKKARKTHPESLLLSVDAGEKRPPGR